MLKGIAPCLSPDPLKVLPTLILNRGLTPDSSPIPHPTHE